MANLSPTMAKASRQLLFSVDAIAVFIFRMSVACRLHWSAVKGKVVPAPNLLLVLKVVVGQ